MRRLLLTALAIALLVGTFAGVASARFAQGSAHGSPTAAPFRAPAAMPRADRSQAGALTFRSSQSIGAKIQRDAAPAGRSAASGGASATVTVTAVVLPVVIIVLDAETGDVAELVTNTFERDASSVVYLVRVGDPEGEAAPLTSAAWSQARAAMADAVAGTGSIWAA